MKILFIFKNENFLAPIGLCNISAVAVKEGHNTYLCEMNSENPLERIAALKPDIVAYSACTGEAKHYLKLNSMIKERFPAIFTIMGGPHPTFSPDVIKEGNLDAVCIGEGEGAFMELLGVIGEGKSPDGLPNIVTRNNKGKFAIRNLVEDLDSLPFPDYGLLYDNTPMGKYPLKNFIVSRGCAYDCTYCFNAAWRQIYKGHGTSVRRHSVDYAIDDIRKVKERWPLSNVKFYDDIFTYRADDWLEEFSRKYKKYIDLPFFILTRADLLTEDMVKLLKHAGCRTISMSIESGNTDIRNRMLKRGMSDEDIISAHRLCEKYGIHTFTNCIIGLPGTSIDNDIESIDLAIKARVTWVEFLIFHPYPRTELGQQSINTGLYNPDYKKMHTSYMHSSPLNCFNQKQKNAQMNLSVLGAVAVVLPRLRNLIVRHLIFWRHSRFFTLVYYSLKMYVLRKKIYVTRTTALESLRILARSLRQEWFRHENQTG
ncbi:MAG: radical SAM protein [Candidatus Omnitrophica bacterium]|nr:radical SAM protein [Candidatus Omnitrophota bacterium]